MAEQQRSAEINPVKEVPRPYYELAALQARFLLGGAALNPQKKDIPAVTKEQLGNFQSRDYSPFNNASTSERQEAAGVKKDELDQAIDAWAKKTVEVLKQDFSTKSGFDNQKAKRWQETLTKILGVGLQELTVDQIKQIYNRFFTGNNKNSDVKLFVDSILHVYLAARSADGTFHHFDESLYQNLDAIQWFSNIFGATSSEIIAQLIDAEAKFMYQPKKLIGEANQKKTKDNAETLRVNSLLPDEERLLGFVWGKGKVVVQPVQTPKPAEPQKPPQLPARPPTPQPEQPNQQDVLLKMPKRERLENLPLNNVAAAITFCTDLRRRLQEEGQEIKGTPSRFVDGKSGIYIYADGRDEIDSKLFAPNTFIFWAENNNLPVSIMIVGGDGGHALLLLKMEERNGRKGYVYYDPLSNGEHWQELKIQMSRDEFINDLIRKRQLIKKPSLVKIQGRPSTEDYYLVEDEKATLIEPNGLTGMWLEQVMPVTTIVSSSLGLTQIGNEDYDLTLAGDTELPKEIIDSKIVQFQHDGRNCVPISFFAGAVRYAAKPGDNEFKRRGIKKFEEDFGIKILTREELLA